MAWSKPEINRHKTAAKELYDVIREVIELIRHKKDLTEYDIQQFILGQFQARGLRTDKLQPIVAFGTNTSFVHYHPQKNSKKLRSGTLIMIDIWAGLRKRRAPFADITWMLYYGRNLPTRILKDFNKIFTARDLSIKHIERSLRKKIIPTGREIDAAAREYLARQGLNIPHSVGHPLGYNGAHGRGRRVNPRARKPIYQNVVYTIEPGIYFSNNYGLRSEIDFYIDDQYKLIITTPLQKKIIIIKPN